MTRRIRLVAGVVVTALAAAVLPGLGAAPASADAPCSYGGYHGDATVSIDGAATVGSPVTATFVRGGDWTAGAGARDLSYTWSGTGLGTPAKGPTFTARPDVVGADVRLVVRARNDAGRVSFTAVCSLPRIGWGSLARPAAPHVTGEGRLGGTLHAAPGDGDRLPVDSRYHYEWFAGGSESAFAVGDSVELRRAQVGKQITVKAMVTALGRHDSAWSVPTITEPVVAGTLPTPAAPAVDGSAVMAGVLTATQPADEAAPEGATYEFRWLSGIEPFATGRRVTLSSGQVGARITAQSRVRAPGYATSAWSASSSPTAVVAPGVLETPSAVTLGGVPKVGEVLTASVAGSWTPGTEVTFAWKADGVPFSTSPGSVRLDAAQVGAHVTVTIAGALDGYVGASVESASSEPVAAGTLLATPGRPTISGAARVGHVLTATVAQADPSWPAGTTYSYRWLAGGEQFATGAQATLGAAQVGRVVTVQVQVGAPGFASSAWSPSSAATAAVAGGAVSGPRAVRITGTPRVGKRLTASTVGSWPAGTSVTWTWRANGIAFGDHAISVLLTAAQRGKRITVQATGVRAGYDATSVVSAPTAPVAIGRLTAPTPKIAGAAAVRRLLVVRPGSWTARTRLTFRWYAGGKAIKGATGRSLRLTGKLRRARITVVVTGRLAGYATVSRTSKRTAKVR